MNCYVLKIISFLYLQIVNKNIV